MANLYTQKDSNIRKTWLLMTVFLVFVIALGYLFSYVLNSPVILYVAVIFSVLMNFIAYWKSDKIALAMSGARPIAREENVRLYRIIENLSITAGLPMPRLYRIPGAQINAFATGRDAKHAAVAVTQGALEQLDDNELQGVLAHELSHIGNRDILISTIVVVLAGLIAIMADWFLRITYWGGRNNDSKGNSVAILLGVLAAILAPIAATLIRLAVSRRREFLADTSGALLTRYPEGLARALEKISRDATPLRTAHSATAHLFLANPFKGREKTSWFTKLFMTHPPVEERIAILRGMEI
ncbi:MAG: M48 family metallopeptidase [Candidatus Yanofskybacteria bacterium]|nr:M48 family metallopeptidase [Candidatus Yanofskybacteria bacterium]